MKSFIAVLLLVHLGAGPIWWAGFVIVWIVGTIFSLIPVTLT